MDSYQATLQQASISLLRWDEDLCASLSGVILPFLGGKKIMPVSPRSDVIEVVLNVVKSRRAETIVVEHQYIDADYLETFARHYSKSFRQRESKCLRLHFFRKQLSASDLLTMPEPTRNAYLGYCILRPTGNQYVSRTVLCPPHEPDHDARFIPAAARFPVHLLGHELSVNGAPFIQQDANTFVCAGAAIWTVSFFMHAEHHTPRYFPAEITELARASFSHGQVRKGLTAAQITMTLQRMNLNPYVEAFQGLQELRAADHDAHSTLLARLRDIIHIFVDSGIPPILAYWQKGRGGHAVAVVGHDIAKRDLSQVQQLPTGVVYNSEFVDTFYVMDDARGPYVPFHVKDGHGTPSLAECDQVSIIAPTPPEVTLDYEDVRRDVLGFVGFWNAVIPGPVGQLLKGVPRFDAAKYLLRRSPENPVVLRTALLDSRSWKLQVIKSDLPEWLKHRYQALLLPKFVWVIEISDFANINHDGRSDRRIFGEAVLDATANPHWPCDGLICFHTKGLLLDASRPGVAPQLQFCAQPDLLYPPVRRSI